MKLVSNDKRLNVAVNYAQRYFDSKDFRADILANKEYEHANVKAEDILDLFDKFKTWKKTIQIKLTYFGVFYKNVLGKTIGNGEAYVNTSGMDRVVWEISATVVHEVGHVVDQFFPEASFGHGSNSAGGKGDSFPYYIGSCASRWIKREVLWDEVEKITKEIEKSRVA